MKFGGETEIGPLMPKIAIWNLSPGFTDQRGSFGDRSRINRAGLSSCTPAPAPVRGTMLTAWSIWDCPGACSAGASGARFDGAGLLASALRSLRDRIRKKYARLPKSNARLCGLTKFLKVCTDC